MLYGEKSREDLNIHAEQLFKKVIKKADRRQLYDEISGFFHMPVSAVEEMITFKRDIKEYSTFEVFCVVWFLDRDCLGKYFTEDEIKYLSQQKIETETIDFPITFNNLVQIQDDQWIGKIQCKTLMQLKQARKINYEEGEQRAFRRMKSGNMEIWRPFVSNKNVREIRELMQSGTYIPDPITLNMPEGSEFSFDNGTLTVYSLPKGMFNLDDGYHRYLAMSEIYDFNKDFDYPMELRIVNFSNAKANAFIFQQDQKTPMRKVVSDSYNVNSIANKVIQKLNQDPASNIQGMIGRNDAKISAPTLNKLIEYFFVTKDEKKESENATVISIKNDLMQKFNTLTEQNEIFLGKYNDILLFVTLYVFASDVLPKDYSSTIIRVCESLTPEEKRVFGFGATGRVRKRCINILDKKVVI